MRIRIFIWCGIHVRSEFSPQMDFSKNLRASLFNDNLSNEPNFGRIHLAGQYLLNLSDMFRDRVNEPTYLEK